MGKKNRIPAIRQGEGPLSRIIFQNIKSLSCLPESVIRDFISGGICFMHFNFYKKKKKKKKKKQTKRKTTPRGWSHKKVGEGGFLFFYLGITRSWLSCWRGKVQLVLEPTRGKEKQRLLRLMRHRLAFRSRGSCTSTRPWNWGSKKKNPKIHSIRFNIFFLQILLCLLESYFS